MVSNNLITNRSYSKADQVTYDIYPAVLIVPDTFSMCHPVHCAHQLPSPHDNLPTRYPHPYRVYPPGNLPTRYPHPYTVYPPNT